MLEWFLNVGEMDGNQQKLLMAHELKHFGTNKDGECCLKGHDFEEFYLISDRFGSRWTNPRAYVEDILAPDFRWGTEGQSRLGLDIMSPPDPEGIMAEVTARINAGELDADGVAVTAKLHGLAAELVGNFGLEQAKAIVGAVKDTREGVPNNVRQMRRSGAN